MKYGSYFTGGGVGDYGAKRAGFTPVFGVERDPSNLKMSMRAADHYESVFGDHMTRQTVQDIDPDDLPRVDWFHASPVCKNYSAGKTSASGDEEIDIITAQATADYIAYHMPRWVSIENVVSYDNSDALNIILRTLIEICYRYESVRVMMANYGVPQTRRRLIVLARLGAQPGFPAPTHAKEPAIGLFSTLQQWRGWYGVIEDLIPTLPDTELAPWQLERLPAEYQTALIPDQYQLLLQPNEPAPTIRALASGGIPPRALIVNGTTDDYGRTVTTRERDEPVFTITATQGKRPARAIIGTRVVQMTPRALARFQSIPDCYPLPENHHLASMITGNGVPSLFMQRLGEHIKKVSV